MAEAVEGESVGQGTKRRAEGQMRKEDVDREDDDAPIKYGIPKASAEEIATRKKVVPKKPQAPVAPMVAELAPAPAGASNPFAAVAINAASAKATFASVAPPAALAALAEMGKKVEQRKEEAPAGESDDDEDERPDDKDKDDKGTPKAARTSSGGEKSATNPIAAAFGKAPSFSFGKPVAGAGVEVKAPSFSFGPPQAKDKPASAFSFNATGDTPFSFSFPAPTKTPSFGGGSGGPLTKAAIHDGFLKSPTAASGVGTPAETAVFGQNLSPTSSTATAGFKQKKPAVAMTDKPVETGEEDETHVFEMRAKAFVMDIVKEKKDGAEEEKRSWLERGTGPLRINKNGVGKCRLVMREEKTHRLIANFPIFAEMVFTPMTDKSLRVTSVGESGPVTFLFKTSRKEEQVELRAALERVVKDAAPSSSPAKA